MDQIQELRNQFKALIDGTEDKELVVKLGAIGKTIDAVEANTNKASEDYRSLLKDYSDLVKTTAFKVEDKTKVDEGRSQEPQSFEDFIASYDPNKK